eukprot:9537111-Ditylum_brightwellii.AAC.1
MEAFDSTEDGDAAFQAYSNHYNDQGELSKCIALAKAKFKHLFYRNKFSISFECYSEQPAKNFQALEKDDEEA